VPEGLRVGKRLELAGRRLGQALVAQPQRQAPKARVHVQIALAAVIVEIAALASRHDQGAGRLMRFQIGLGMQMGGDIHLAEVRVPPGDLKHSILVVLLPKASGD
jgi:hypothetical protein